jgi:hypothetical protein
MAEHDDIQTQKVHRFVIRIDEHTFTVTDPEPTGRFLLGLVGKDFEDHFLTQILPGVDDIVVGPDDHVDLRKPGVERFTVVAKPCEIVVNTRSFPFSNPKISFDEVVRLAFDTSGDDANTVYTVTYVNGDHSKPEGSMVKNDRIKVHCGMEFDVDRTNRS